MISLPLIFMHVITPVPMGMHSERKLVHCGALRVACGSCWVPAVLIDTLLDCSMWDGHTFNCNGITDWWTV